MERNTFPFFLILSHMRGEGCRIRRASKEHDRLHKLYIMQSSPPRRTSPRRCGLNKFLCAIACLGELPANRTHSSKDQWLCHLWSVHGRLCTSVAQWCQASGAWLAQRHEACFVQVSCRALSPFGQVLAQLVASMEKLVSQGQLSELGYTIMALFLVFGRL